MHTNMHAYDMYNMVHVIYVTWAGRICLICMHKSKGECIHIRQILTTHVTYIMQLSWHSKNLPKLHFTVLSPIIMMDAVYGHGFLNQVRVGLQPARTWFLKIVSVQTSVCFVCVCLPPKLLITSCVMWRDMDPIQLVKQVL